MNICINYYGQPRKLNDCYNIYTETILDTTNKFYICYTTWDTEDITTFKNFFKDSFINTIKQPESLPDETQYTIDPSNPNKKIKHYLLGLYIKQKSKETILQVEQNLKINFDIIITIRTDAFIWDGKIKDYYNNILNNKIYVAKENKFDIYNTGAVPDVCYFGKRDTILSSLDHLNYIKYCTVKNTNYFHPETSLYTLFKYLKLDIIECEFKAFPYKL